MSIKNLYVEMDENGGEGAGMKPYYIDERAGITLYCGDCREILPTLLPVDIVLTDPPYSEKTHAGARSTSDHEPKGGHVAINFNSVDAEFVRQVLSAATVRRWCISFLDWRHALSLEQNPPDGLEFVRLGVWTKTNPMPQLTGDRPSTGWEAVAIFHPPGKKRWNGGAGPAVWMHGTTRYGYFGPSNHPTEKPVGLVARLLEQFSGPGELVLNPFAGSGTTLVASKRMGRKAIGIELAEKYAEIAAKRLEQEVFDFGPAPKPEPVQEALL